MMDSMELEGLLQQAEQLSASISETEDFPRLEKNISQILQNSSELWTRTGGNAVGSSASSVAKASVLLGTKGLDLPEMQSQLKRLEELPVLQNAGQVAEEQQDLESILRNERQRVIVSLIEETSRRVLEDSHRRHWDSMMRQWHTHKQHILNTLVASQDLMMDLTSGAVNQYELNNTTVNGTSGDGNTTLSAGGGGGGIVGSVRNKHVSAQRHLSRLEMLYSRQVAYLNEKHVQQGTVPSVVTLFKDVGVQSEDMLCREIWEMVGSTVLSLSHGSTSTLGLSSPAHRGGGNDSTMSSTYMDSTAAFSSRLSPNGQNLMVETSLDYLHHRFKKYVQSVVFEDLHSATIGGTPSVLKLAKAYLNLTLKSLVSSNSQFDDGRLDGVPVWALVYVCLRLGDSEAALEVAQKAPQGLGDFGPILEEYAKGGNQLSYNTIVNLTLAYRRTVHKSSDVFKRVVYCVLGQCDIMENHTTICNTVEDYLWLKLSQVKRYTVTSVEQELSSEVLTLDKLQSMVIEEYGESHFKAASQPFLYFQVLWLCGLFEDSIEFLSRSPHLRAHSVHIALALLEDDLLLQSEPFGNGQIINLKRSKQGQFKQLNFARLVMLYVKNFEKTNPSEALQYLFLLRNSYNFGENSLLNISDYSTDNMFLQCVAELAIETRDYVTLFGTRDFNDVRHAGLVDKLDTENSIHVITKVASSCEKQGMFEDAIYLFDLAGKKDKALAILNRILVPLVPATATTSDGGRGSSRDRVVKIALELAERYRKVGFVGTQSAMKTFYLLLDLVTFFDLFNSNEFEDALEVAERLNIVPPAYNLQQFSQAGEVGGGEMGENDMERMLENFKSVSEEVKQCYPQTLLAAMTIITSQYSKLNNSSSLMGPSSASFSSPRAATRLDQSSSSTCSVATIAKKKHQLRTQARLLTTFVGRIPYRMPADVNTQMAQMELMMN